jgi:GTPase SAR1 family protein
MDSWRVAVLGDGGVGKTALAVQVSPPSLTIVMHTTDHL